MNYAKTLSAQIRSRKATIGIIGVGYVGKALADALGRAGFPVLGFTRSQARADKIGAEKIPNLTMTTDAPRLGECSVICICVPTPVHADKTPDLEPLIDASQKTARYLKKETLVIVESTVAPGTTRNVVLPILKTSGLREEQDFFLSFSPERVDPGNTHYTLANTPKVVSGLSPVSTRLVTEFYRSFVDAVVPVSSPEAAEMSKVLENTFRFVNISLINELVEYTNTIGVDMWEVIAASSTKPYGFLPHYPGPGIGGHCIPVDPYYLLDDAAKRGIELGILKQTGIVNELLPRKVVKKALTLLKQTNGKKAHPHALIVGIAYKENIDDDRESPSIKIWELLEKENVRVSYHDPFILRYNGTRSKRITRGSIQDTDIIILVTPHSTIDYAVLTQSGKPIIDTRNVLKSHTSRWIFRL